MEQGRAEVHNTPGTLLFRRLSLQDLYWYDKKRSRASRRRLIDADDARQAYGCKACGLVTIDTTTPLGQPSRWWRRGNVAQAAE